MEFIGVWSSCQDAREAHIRGALTITEVHLKYLKNDLAKTVWHIMISKGKRKNVSE